MTYSIVARDPDDGRLGVAVQSCVVASGTRVAAARPGIGVVAVQAGAPLELRAGLLARLEEGAAPEEVAAQAGPAMQVGLVDASGRAAAATGPDCEPAAGHGVGDGASVQGNLLDRPGLWHEGLAAYLAHRGPFEERLLAALRAIEEGGGDLRGSQSAALLVVSGQRNTAPTGGADDPFVDLRVDDHPDPVGELARVWIVQRAHRHVIRALSGGDDWEAAAAEADAAYALAPDDWITLFVTGTLRGLAGRLDEAGPLLSEAAARNPRAARRLRQMAGARPSVAGAAHYPSVLAALEPAR